jgi:hypothetical protein
VKNRHVYAQTKKTGEEEEEEEERLFHLNYKFLVINIYTSIHIYNDMKNTMP